MPEKVLVDPRETLSEWRLAQANVASVTEVLSSKEQEIKDRQNYIRTGEYTTGSEMNDFLFASSSLEQLQGFETLSQTCETLSQEVESHAGELILRVSGSNNKHGSSIYRLDFGVLSGEPKVNYELSSKVKALHQWSDLHDALFLPTTKVATMRSDQRSTYEGPIGISRSELERLSFSEVAATEDEDSGAYTLVLIGADAVMNWFTDNKGLREFYENCFRIGQNLDIPPEIAEEINGTALFLGARIIDRLVRASSGERHLQDHDLEAVKATGKTPSEVIRLAAALAIERLEKDK